MAKSKYPLMCETARGIFGRQLVYRETKGIPVVSTFRPPTDRKTPAQLVARQKFRDIASAWNSHTQEERDTLQPFVKGKNLTTYDYYTKKFIETGEDPLGPPPGPSTTPLEFRNMLSAHIIETRSTLWNGWLYSFWGWISQTLMGGIYDNQNTYIDYETLDSPETIIGVIHPGYETMAIQAGDRIHIVWEVGELDIYLPEYSGPMLPLFLADDGSTYYDPGMTQLAYAAP